MGEIMQNNFKSIQLPLMIILNIIIPSHGDLELVIPNIAQETQTTCWAACCRMVDKAYNPESIRLENFWTTMAGTSGSHSITGSDRSVDKLLSTYAEVSTLAGSGSLQFSNSTSDKGIKQQIDGGRPIVIRRAATWGGHFMLITGYWNDADQTVIVQDPWNQSTPKKIYRIKYSELLEDPDNTLIRWTHTCRLTSNPKVKIPTPIGGGTAGVGISIGSLGGPFSISPSTTTLQFLVSCTQTPTSYRWKVVFPHSNGECVVASSTLGNYKIWTYPNFSMPTGYQWIYNYDGVIPGWVSVELYYAGGTLGTLYFQQGINYVPTNRYSGTLIYENKTVSNLQSDVKAHELLITKNDQFLPGANINLKSGEAIEINSLTIQNGATTSLIIDPSLK